jgi:hypothetical protein
MKKMREKFHEDVFYTTCLKGVMSADQRAYTSTKHVQKSGSWSSDPYFWLTDPAPDPTLFGSDLQDAKKNNLFLLSFYAYSFLKYTYIIL